MKSSSEYISLRSPYLVAQLYMHGMMHGCVLHMVKYLKILLIITRLNLYRIIQDGFIYYLLFLDVLLLFLYYILYYLLLNRIKIEVKEGGRKSGKSGGGIHFLRNNLYK